MSTMNHGEKVERWRKQTDTPLTIIALVVEMAKGGLGHKSRIGRRGLPRRPIAHRY